LETAELKQGEIKPHLLNIRSQFGPLSSNIGDGSHLELPSISPDGKFAFQRIDGVWHLIGLWSGSDTEIRNTRVGYCLSLSWFPDQKNILCEEKYDIVISLEGYADRKLPLMPSFMQILTWLP
jgi:hypothetical protein